MSEQRTYDPRIPTCTYVTEVYARDSQQVKVSRREDSREIGSMSWDGFELEDRIDTIDDLSAAGFSILKEESRKTVPLMPMITVHTVFDDLCKLAPELANHKLEAQALIKRLSHVEKHSVYSRLQQYAGSDSTPWFRSILDEKVGTHLLYANLPDAEIITWKL